jgi:transposase-like protein
MPETFPRTLVEAVHYYANLRTCFDYMVALKWPDGKIVCPKCNGDKIGLITTRSMLQCKSKGCRKQFSAKVGTIFEDSPLPLSQWFVAVWCIANAKNGISSCELARALGVHQKTAWFMLHRIRCAMHTPTHRKLCGVTESDETFVGGRAENMHAHKRSKRIQGRGPVGKAIVHGILERTSPDSLSEVRASVVPNTEADTLVPELIRNVEAESTVYTDAATSYAALATRFAHKAVDHATAFVIGSCHVNGMENFWSLLKRMLKGTYVAVAPFHLFRYVDEEAFRFNERGTNDAGRFRLVMQGVLGKRLTYRRLCAIGDSGFMGIP